MHNIHRRRFAFALAGLALTISAAAPALAHPGEHGPHAGLVFTSTNSLANNELLVFAHAKSGELELAARVATHGQGTGAGLGSQGAVTLSTDGRYVFVVNARSNTVSTFAIHGDSVTLASVADSGGFQPVSVTENDGMVVVLNAGGEGNVSGFRNERGELKPLTHGTRRLSASGGTNPAQVGFGADGDVLVVTEKATSRITSYAVRRDGTLGSPVVSASSGSTPFGFAFDRRDHLIVSEAVGSAASSYRFDERSATPTLLSASVPNTQAAACWVAITPNGKYAYTANAGTSSLSSYRISRSGRIELANAVAGSTGVNASATDMAISGNGRHLYALAPRSLQIVSFDVSYDGSLAPAGAVGGLPTGTVGLAAN